MTNSWQINEVTGGSSGDSSDVAGAKAGIGATRRTSPEPNTQGFTKGIRSLHNARFNQHLSHRDIDLGDQLLHLLQLGSDICHKQLVGPGFKNHTATRAQNPAGIGPRATTGSCQARCNLCRFCIVQLERLCTQWLQILQRSDRFELQFFLGIDFVLRRDPDHIACLAHPETFGLQNNVERLIPRYVLQAQCDGAVH